MKQGLHKNSFLTYNILFHFSKSTGFYPGLEFINSMTVCRHTVVYYYRRIGRLPHLYTFYKASPQLLLTTSKSGLSFFTKKSYTNPNFIEC